MEQTRSLFIIKRYRSVVGAALVIELVAYLATLTDTLVAGSLISEEALTAIGLMTPFNLIIVFLSAAINSGTTLGYTGAAGRFDRRHANEVFSQGILSAAAAGILFTAAILAIREHWLAGLSVSPEVIRYLREYYGVIAFFYLFRPLNAVLDNIVLNDGGEKYSAAANIVQTAGNILFSVILSKPWGVSGIALASVLSQLAGCLIAGTWLFNRRSTLRLVRYFHLKEALTLYWEGSTRAGFFVLHACTVGILNYFVLTNYGGNMLASLIVVENLLHSSDIFMGLSLAMQPLISSLIEEGNTKAERDLLRVAGSVVLAAGIVLSMLFVIAAPVLLRIYGLTALSQVQEGSAAIRITCATIACRALVVFIFIYLYLRGNRGPAFLFCILGEFAAPVGLGILGALVMQRPAGLWIGLAAAPVLSLILIGAADRMRRKRDRFTGMLHERDDRIFIYDFPLCADNITAVTETADAVLKANHYPAGVRNILEVLSEDILGLILDYNREAKKKLLTEYTLILEKTGVRLILRDEGRIFDITDADEKLKSFRQYMVSRLLTIPRTSKHILAAGYNRNEFFLENQAGKTDDE